MRTWGRGIRIALLFSTGLSSFAQTGLKVVVVEGEGALNNIEAHHAKEPVIRVEDEDGEPLGGAVVSFILPGRGSSGAFGAGEASLTLTTGRDGLAAGRGLKPNRIAGPFKIRVTASLHGEIATTDIHQTNVGPANAASGRTKKVALLAVIGGAAIGGVVAATRGGKSSPAGSNAGASVPGSATVVVGTPSFGPPH
jgi:hypothetical protein